MKFFLSTVSLLLLGLFIYTGCDSLFMPGGDDLLSGNDVGVVAWGEVDPSVLEDLEGAIRAMAVEIDAAYDDNPACIEAPLPRDDADALNDRLDQLLGQIEDDLNRDNFPYRIAELEPEDWLRMDSVALFVLLDDYIEFRASYEEGCPEDAELLEKAHEIFREYVDIIQDLGPDGWDQLVDTVLPDDGTDPCMKWCRKRLRKGVFRVTGRFLMQAALCTGADFINPLVGIVCDAGNILWTWGAGW